MAVKAHKCTKCRQTKRADQFLPSALRPSGLSDRCKPCVFFAAREDRRMREQHAAAKAAIECREVA